MEEVTKTKKTMQSMSVLMSPTVRGIVDTVNSEGIKKDNIVSLLKDNGQFILVFYK